MYFYFVIFLTLQLQYAASEEPSHGSLWMEEGHPILRKAKDGEPESSAELPPEDGYWVADLRSDIKSLINEHGSLEAKPFIEKLVGDAAKSHKVFLLVKVKTNGRSGIDDQTRRYENLLKGVDGRFIPLPKRKNPRDDTTPLKILGERIYKFVQKHGYVGAKPYIQRDVDDVEEIMKTGLHVKVFRNGKSIIYYKPKPRVTYREPTAEYSPPKILYKFRESVEAEDSAEPDSPSMGIPLDQREQEVLVSVRPSQPDWVGSFKTFVRGMMTAYSKQELLKRLKARELEKQYGINLKLMDFDIVGDIAEQQKGRREKSRKSNLDDGTEWKSEFKSYVKNLVTKVGRQKVLMRLTPVVESIQKKFSVNINDIDVDEHGEVYLDIDKKRSSKKTKPTRERRKDEDALRADETKIVSRPKWKKKKTANVKSPSSAEHDARRTGEDGKGAEGGGAEGGEGDKRSKRTKLDQPDPREQNGKHNKVVALFDAKDAEDEEWQSDLKLYARYLWNKYKGQPGNNFDRLISPVIEKFEMKYGVEIRNFRYRVDLKDFTYDLFRHGVKVIKSNHPEEVEEGPQSFKELDEVLGGNENESKETNAQIKSIF